MLITGVPDALIGLLDKIVPQDRSGNHAAVTEAENETTRVNASVTFGNLGGGARGNESAVEGRGGSQGSRR